MSKLPAILYSLFPSSIYLAFGVARDLSGYPHALVLNLEESLKLADGSEHQNISLNIYNFDPTLAPAGKTTVTALINTWECDYWQGSYEGFAPTPAALMKRMPKEIKGLANFYMIGQWTEPGGGIPSAALDGRNVCKKLCKQDKINFERQEKDSEKIIKW